MNIVTLEMLLSATHIKVANWLSNLSISMSADLPESKVVSNNNQV